jgi:hypothetical protein
MVTCYQARRFFHRDERLAFEAHENRMLQIWRHFCGLWGTRVTFLISSRVHMVD